jgi:hypothetical protein
MKTKTSQKGQFAAAAGIIAKLTRIGNTYSVNAGIPQ